MTVSNAFERPVTRFTPVRGQRVGQFAPSARLTAQRPAAQRERWAPDSSSQVNQPKGNRMARSVVSTTKALPSPATYSQAVKAGGLVFISGTGPFELGTAKIEGEAIQERTRQCLTDISAILNAAGSSLDKVASATVILLEEEDLAGLNEEWVKWFPVDQPARQSAKLPVHIPGLKVSIAAIAEA